MGSSREIIRKLMLEEEEELFFVLIPTLYSCRYEEKRPVHTSSLPSAKKVKEILEGHESWSKVDVGLNPFLSTNLDEVEVEPTTSAYSAPEGEGPVKRQKQSQVAVVLEEYLNFRKKQSKKFAEEIKEAPKEDDKYSIANCVATLEAIEELTDLEKAKVLQLFKCPLNRELLINSKI